MSRLNGIQALVTGASSGIGWETSRQLAAAGVRVALSARRTERLERLADVIDRDGGPRPIIVTADLGRPGEAARVAEEALAALGQIDLGAGGTRTAITSRSTPQTSCPMAVGYRLNR